jgi:hypothetical protein
VLSSDLASAADVAGCTPSRWQLPDSMRLVMLAVPAVFAVPGSLYNDTAVLQARGVDRAAVHNMLLCIARTARIAAAALEGNNTNACARSLQRPVPSLSIQWGWAFRHTTLKA